jgi:hypothetical protein
LFLAASLLPLSGLRRGGSENLQGWVKSGLSY